MIYLVLVWPKFPGSGPSVSIPFFIRQIRPNPIGTAAFPSLSLL